MKYGIMKFYEPSAEEKAAAITTESVMKELGNIKSALELNQTKKLAEQEKNWEEKAAAYDTTIAELKSKIEANEATTEVVAELKKNLDLTIKAFDLLQIRMKSDSMKNNTNNAGGNGKSEDMTMGTQIKNALFGAKDDIKSAKIIGKSKDEQMTLKAVQDMTVIGNVNTGVVPNTYRQGIVPVPFEMVHMRNLVNVTPSETDSYHFYRHQIGEGSITFQGNENGAKSQFDEDLLEQTVNLDYLAGFLKISRKMLRNFTALQAYISRWLPEKYYEAEDTKAYQSLISQATGVQDTTGTDMISVIIRTIGKQKKAKYNVNGIVIDGEVWARLLTYKASTSGEFTQPIGVVTISPAGQLLICGIPVYTASWVGGDEAIIGDWRFFEIIQSEALSLGFFEQDDKNVQQNKITVRIEASVGFAMLDPKGFVVAALESVS